MSIPLDELINALLDVIQRFTPALEPYNSALGSSDDGGGFWRYLMMKALRRVSFASYCYPYDYVYALVKIGYVPYDLASYEYVKGDRILHVPSIKEYMEYMTLHDGDQLMLRGEVSFCLAYTIYCLVDFSLMHLLNKGSQPKETLSQEYHECALKKAASTFVAVVITHPLLVLSYRQMAQYIGKEDMYSSSEAFKLVFTEPGIYPLVEGILPRYVFMVIPAVCGAIAGRAYIHWMDGRISWLPPFTKFVNATSKGSRYHWVTVGIQRMIDISVEFFVLSVLSPLEVGVITTSVWRSGLVAGQEPFVPDDANWISRFVQMVLRGQVWRSARYIRGKSVKNHGAYVVY